MSLQALAEEIRLRAAGRSRFILAIAGPPGAGKSTLAEGLLSALEAIAPGEAAILPMDGYHYDNAVLAERGLLARKGAPATFDVGGFLRDLGRIRAGDAGVAVPVFDRDLDLARAAARLIEPRHGVVLVEGNYLLLPEPPWRELAVGFDLSLYLDVPEAELRSRLVARWLAHGLDPEAAVARAEGNDLVNARTVAVSASRADLLWRDGAAEAGAGAARAV